MNPPDAKFQEVLETILTPVKGVSAGIRLSNAESLLLTWLDDNGKFIRTPEGELFYLWHDKHRLFELDTELWHAWLHELTGVNPASTGFSVLSNACKTAAILNSEIKNVVCMAYYDNDTKLLWVSRFDGKCYCLDGDSITLKVNGDGPVIFDDLHIWEPYEPDLTINDAATVAGSLGKDEPQAYSGRKVYSSTVMPACQYVPEKDRASHGAPLTEVTLPVGASERRARKTR